MMTPSVLLSFAKAAPLLATASKRKTTSRVPHAQLRKALVEIGARRLAEDPLPRAELCTLETWMLPGMASRLLLIEHYHRSDRWEHFFQGAEAGTHAAIEEILAVFGGAREAPPGDAGASKNGWWP